MIYSGASCNFSAAPSVYPPWWRANLFGVTRHRSPTIVRAIAPIRLPANELSAVIGHGIPFSFKPFSQEWFDTRFTAHALTRVLPLTSTSRFCSSMSLASPRLRYRSYPSRLPQANPRPRENAACQICLKSKRAIPRFLHFVAFFLRAVGRNRRATGYSKYVSSCA